MAVDRWSVGPHTLLPVSCSPLCSARRLMPLRCDDGRQRVYRGWMVRRTLVTAVRDEFQSMLADVGRRATVQALRAQQQSAQMHGHEGLYSTASTLAAAGSADRAQPVYRRDTLCRPRFQVPEKQQQQPAQSAIATPAVHSASPVSNSSDSVRTLPSEGSSSTDAESKEQKDGLGSPPQQLPGDAAPLSSLQVEPPQSPTPSAAAFASADGGSHAPPHLEPTGAWRPLETQILSVQAAIRQRLLVRRDFGWLARCASGSDGNTALCWDHLPPLMHLFVRLSSSPRDCLILPGPASSPKCTSACGQ